MSRHGLCRGHGDLAHSSVGAASVSFDDGASRFLDLRFEYQVVLRSLHIYTRPQDGDIESVSQSKRVVKLKLEQAPKLCLIIKKPNGDRSADPNACHVPAHAKLIAEACSLTASS